MNNNEFILIMVIRNFSFTLHFMILKNTENSQHLEMENGTGDHNVQEVVVPMHPYTKKVLCTRF